jgi:hypothetical protein
LASQPSADVIIAFNTSNPSEAILSSLPLTFNSDNWDLPQTITVTGVDDFVEDGDTVYAVLVGIASSADSNFDGTSATDVRATNVDGTK